MKNSKNLIIVGAIILVILVSGIFVLVSKKSTKPTPSPAQSEEILALSPDDIGLTLEMGSDGKRVIMEVAKIGDLTSIDYQLSYTSKGDIPRGVIGALDVKGKTIKKEIILGTCSDVCHYDQNVSNIKIILKVTKTDGKIYQVEKSL
ncbi:MAG: hypothetical protein A3B44_02370 [Candidatus Levybacteria bacterium RIFCSPLOWO2_01_FULL_38_21]|nr:MAG: hypothetical protein A3B44_02370 [Candidatus Levybacteria bacterium RIFCSPLOWO2_01_FULL_38_21]